jgi:hypothetical protein
MVVEELLIPESSATESCDGNKGMFGEIGKQSLREV